MLWLVNKFRDSAFGLPICNGRFTVSLLRPRDLWHVAWLERENFPEPLSFWKLLCLWLQPATTYLALKEGGRLAAYIGFQAYGPMAHTISMCVAPAYRRRGLGKFIQQAADQVAVRRGLRWFCGEVRVSNAAQLKMLSELGWQKVGVVPRFFANGEDAVLVLGWLEGQR
ncbi:MAG: GNAT family N-acetyltransferase [Bacillota bacterium]|jgi:ribosomal-protein-alanine N-acetyltransferase|nr:GNAT family N-acetyltransferase [Bacillota bacterium]HHU29908.1 GNAT family N-acetyltransferase [Bacillota bacterium]